MAGSALARADRAFATAGFAIVLPWGSDDERERSERLAAGVEQRDRAAAAQSLPSARHARSRAPSSSSASTRGSTHLAAALGTPTVSLFTATDAALAGVAAPVAHARDLGGNGRVPSLDDVQRAAGELRARARRAAEMARALYTLLWWVALPSLPLRLWWRGRREPGYRERIGERFGRYAATPRRRRGRLDPRGFARRNARRGAAHRAHPRARIPTATLLLTHMTATGREAGRALYGERVVQAWLPYDVPFAVRAFLARFRPRAGLLMETELWPNLIAALRAGERAALSRQRAHVRAVARGYARFPALDASDVRRARRHRGADRRRRERGSRGWARATSPSPAT